MTTSAGAPPKSSSDYWLLALLLVLAAAVRAFAWRQTAVLFNDGPVFLGMAEAIREGRWDEILIHPYHPLYPALIALVSSAGVPPETAAVLVSIAGGLLSVLAIFLLVRRAFGRDLAWLSAWTVTLHPWAVDFSSDVMSDGLYAGLYLLGFAALLAWVEGARVGSAVACGVAVGLAYLVRPEGLGLAVTAALLVVLLVIARPARRGRVAATFAVLGISVAVLIAPLFLSVSEHSGEASLTRKKTLLGLALGESPGEREARLRPRMDRAADDPRIAGSRPAIPLPISSQRVDGGGAVKPPRTLGGLVEAVSRAGRTSLAALRYEVALLVVVGVWVIRSRKQPLREASMALPVVLYSGLLVLLVWGAGYVARRHALAPLLPLVAYAAIGWERLCDGLSRWLPSDRGGWLRSPRGTCIGLIVVLCLAWGPRDLRPRRDDRAAVRAAAEWLAEQPDSPGRVAAQKLRVAYYAGADYVPLPSGNEGPIEGDLRAEGARWVVIDQEGLVDHRGLAEGVGSWLRTVHAVDRLGHRALVLEVTPEPAI